MSVFAVVLTVPNPGIAARIEEHYPDHYRLNDTICLVQSDDLAEGVATSVGIKGDNRIEGSSGVVFRLNHSYAGYSSRALWDWLQQAQEQE